MKKKKRILPFLIIALIVTVLIAVLYNFFVPKTKKVEKAKELKMPEWVSEDIIHKHTTARTGILLEDIKNIVIHYVGNPNTTAKNNRDYFDNPTTKVSSHFIVGLDGEIIQCVPIYERSAASNNRNKDTISVETCHPDESGKFSEDTYNSLVKLTAYLCCEFNLSEDDVIRHYDITGKVCPKYYVENENEWKNFKSQVGKAIDDYRKAEKDN